MKTSHFLGGAAAVGLLAYLLWPKSSAAATQLAFAPSEAPPKPVNLQAPVPLQAGDNGAYGLAPTRDFLWVQLPADLTARQGLNDLELMSGDFEVHGETREKGQVYLMIPSTARVGQRGSVTFTVVDESRKIVWQAFVTLVAEAG